MELRYRAAQNGLYLERCVHEQDFVMPRHHIHPHYEIYYLVSGERYYFIDRQSYRVPEGSLVLIAPDQIHRTGAAGSAQSRHERILVSIEPTALAPHLVLAGIDLADFFAVYGGVVLLPEEARRRAEQLLDDAAREINEGANGAAYLACYSIVALLLMIQRQAETRFSAASAIAESGPYRKVGGVAGYIAAHYDQPMTLEGLAGQFYVNKCYLSRIFKEITGCTVHEYISLQRMRHAAALLISTDSSITEVAARVGVESLTYFERLFQRHYECTPLAYRRRQRAQNT